MTAYYNLVDGALDVVVALEATRCDNTRKGLDSLFWMTCI